MSHGQKSKPSPSKDWQLDSLDEAEKLPLEIRYQNFELQSNKEYVGEILNAYVTLLPSWLCTLTIEIYDNLTEDQPKSTIAWSIASPEYGHATISILSAWLDRPISQQRLLILHEIFHIAHRREYNFVWDRLLNPVQDRNEELHAFLVEDYRQRNEEFIDGLARAMVNRTGSIGEE